MGGRSTASIDHQDGTLVFRGELNTNGGGFASIRAAIAGGVSGDAIRVRLQGDGRTYQLRLYTSERRYSYAQAFLTSAGQWQTLTLPLDAFVATWRGRQLDRPAPDPAELSGFGFLLADSKDGPFRLVVDRVEAVRL